jgi:hypothetical protein
MCEMSLGSTGIRKYFHDDNEVITEVETLFVSKYTDFNEAGIIACFFKYEK